MVMGRTMNPTLKHRSCVPAAPVVTLPAAASVASAREVAFRGAQLDGNRATRF